MLFPEISHAQTMTVAPFQININAQGNFDDIQCIYGGVIPSGFKITSHSVEVFLEGSYVMNATSVSYCPIDCNIFIEINRTAFQNSPVVQGYANQGPGVLLVIGSFTVTNSLGNAIIFPVNHWGYMEVIKPGNKR